MLIELTPNEVMWINDKIAAECARGKAAIDNLKDDKDPSVQAAVKMATGIVTALAKLGIKLCEAMDKEAAENENGGGKTD